MRINEYNSLEEFTSEYIDIWCPCEGHWYGLDFEYKGVCYRLHTGAMYNPKRTILPDGREAVYGLYILDPTVEPQAYGYTLIREYADMETLLEDCVIDGRKFKDVIMDDSTEITGKD